MKLEDRDQIAEAIAMTLKEEVTENQLNLSK